MKFFTRDLFESQQVNPYKVSEQKMNLLRERWYKVDKEYYQHYQTIFPHLPESAQEFSKHTFHDAEILTYIQKDKDVILKINAENCPWTSIHSQEVTITFKDAKLFEFKGNLKNDIWLYEEIHIVENNFFEYRVLLSFSEFRVIAKDIEVRMEQ